MSLITFIENNFKDKRITALHEIGHFFYDTLLVMAKEDDCPQWIHDVIATIRKEYINNKVRKNTRKRYNTVETIIDEAFAEQFVTFVKEGIAPNKELKTVFEKFKEWLEKILHNIIYSEDQRGVLSPEMKSVMNILLGIEHPEIPPYFENESGTSDNVTTESTTSETETKETISESKTEQSTEISSNTDTNTDIQDSGKNKQLN